MKLDARSMIHLSLAASLLSVAGLPPVLAAQDRYLTVDQLETQVQESWRATMHHTPALQKGCFHASYPRTGWEQVDCADPPAYRSARPISQAESKRSAMATIVSPKSHQAI